MDPTNIPALKQATELIKAGKRHQAQIILAKYVQSFPENEHAWHIMSYALDDKEHQIFALKRALKINPQNLHVKTRLEKLSPSEPPEPKPTPPSTRVARAAPSPQPESLLKASQAPRSGSLPQTAVAPFAQPENPLEHTQTSGSGSLLQTVAANIGVDTSPLKPPVRKSALISQSKPIARPLEILTPAKRFGFWQRLKIRSIISWRRTKLNWRIFAQSPLAIIGLIIIFLFALMAIAHPILIKTVWPRGIYDPATGFDMMVFPNPSPPVSGHILGTDSLGRDVLSMILAATTPTFLVGITAALTTALIGTLLSVTAAYFQGKVDMIITNMADVFLLFPAPIIMVIIGARFRDLGPVELGLFYGFVTGAGATTIVMRAQAMQVAAKPFMEAAHIAGGGPWHIITKHLIPSVMPLAALQMMIAVTGAVVADGFISFFGITRTVNNWGTIIYDAFIYGNISGSYGPPWHMLIPSAACFSLFAMGFYLVSRGLHRVASPSLREDY